MLTSHAGKSRGLRAHAANLGFTFSGSPSKELMWAWRDSSRGWRPLGRLLQDEKGWLPGLGRS